MNRQQRQILVIAILASFVAFLDGSVTNVALPAMVAELGGGLGTQQWIVDAYLITLGSLILLAGSLSDVFGRISVLRFGLIGFGITSVAIALSPTPEFVIVARALQGVAGALLVPSSLALIISAFRDAAQAKAIGVWTAWTGAAFLAGPFLGGLAADYLTWRLVFGINVIPILVTLWMLTRLDKGVDGRSGGRIDILGAVLGVPRTRRACLRAHRAGQLRVGESRGVPAACARSPELRGVPLLAGARPASDAAAWAVPHP